jgi:hypothetical protein
MLSFTLPKLFKYFERWTAELVKKYNDFYQSDKEWRDLVFSIMPFDSLEHLYTGWESGSAPRAPVLEDDDCMDSDMGSWLSSLRPAIVPKQEGKPVNLKSERVGKAMGVGWHQKLILFLTVILAFLCPISLSDLRYPMTQNSLCVREPAKSSSWVMGVGEAPSGGRQTREVQPWAVVINEMSKKK